MMIFEHNIEYLLAFISALFGLSVPIMLQVIERVDSRYDSTRLAERLKSEKVIWACIRLLILSLFTCTYAVFFHCPSPWDCWIMNNSADLIALVSCVLLIICFLLSCRVILVYYNPEKLQDRILDEYVKAKSIADKERCFRDWVDLTKILLASSDRTPAFRVYDTIGKEIDTAFESAGRGKVSFPNYVVRGIISINENLCLMPRRPFSINNDNQILKKLISNPSKLSDDAYRFLWDNLQLQLFYNQEDWVYEYWSAAVQTYDLQLVKLDAGTPSFDNPDMVITKDEAYRRETERKRFKEFHITLCASVLRECRYDLLEKLLFHYRAMTPEYEYPLVPSSLAEIQEAFQMINESPRLDFCADGYYPMRGMKGIADRIVLGSVKRYLTLLYVRLFSNIGRMKSTFANYPITLGGLKRLNEDIDYMLRMLPSIFGNKDLMLMLSFDSFEKAQAEMQTVLGNVKGEIVIREKELRQNKPNDADLVEENLQKVKEIVERELSEFGPFIRDNDEGKDKISYFLNGFVSSLYPNEAFQHDAGISYVNMEECVTGTSISSIRHYFSTVFYQKEQIRLRIGSDNVFEAIDSLVINDAYVIVSFNVYWDYYLTKGISGFIKKDGEYSYKGVPFICLREGPTDLVSQTLFVMLKTDLPSLSYIAPVDEQINKYELRLLDEKNKLYGSIVQLSQSEELLNEVNKMSKDEAKEYSLFNVFIHAKMAWLKNAQVVSIKIMYNMRDNGTEDSVRDVIPFVEMFDGKNNDGITSSL